MPSFFKLMAFIAELNTVNFKFSIICLQDTWIDESEDILPFHLQECGCISHRKTCTSKGGLILYVNVQCKSKVTFNLNNFEHW